MIFLILDKTNLLESSRPSEVYKELIISKDIQLTNSINNIVNYVPYRLISYFWEYDLKVKKGSIKNNLIESYSRESGNHLYMIDYNYKHKRVIVNKGWQCFIVHNKKYLLEWINMKISDFINKSK